MSRQPGVPLDPRSRKRPVVPDNRTHGSYFALNRILSIIFLIISFGFFFNRIQTGKKVYPIIARPVLCPESRFWPLCGLWNPQLPTLTMKKKLNWKKTRNYSVKTCSDAEACMGELRILLKYCQSA